MTPTAAEIHERVLDAYIRATLAGRGQAVTWTDNPFSESPNNVSGYAIRIPGDPDVYRALGLIESESPTLSFVPITLGQRPVDGSTIVFGMDTFTLDRLFPFSPGGVDVSQRAIVKR